MVKLNIAYSVNCIGIQIVKLLPNARRNIVQQCRPVQILECAEIKIPVLSVAAIRCLIAPAMPSVRSPVKVTMVTVTIKRHSIKA